MANLGVVALVLALASAPGYGASLTFVNTTDLGTTFVYAGYVQNNQQIEDGDSFVIFDFAGLLDGTGPNGWLFTQQLEATGAVNDAALPDAVFVYHGLPILGAHGKTALGEFTLSGTFAAQRTGMYLSRSTRANGGNAGESLAQAGNVAVAAPEPADALNAVPEPSTLLAVLPALLLIWKRLQHCERRQ